MNKRSMVFAMMLVASPVFAQESASTSAVPAVALSAPSLDVAGARNDQADTLFGNRKLIEHHGWYAAPSVGFTTIDGDAAGMFGIRTGWLINRRFGLGFAASGFSNDFRDAGSSRGRVEGGYGGVTLQYIIASTRRVHGFTETTIGGGAVCIYGDLEDYESCGEYGFFTIESLANLEVNMTSFARATLGAGYRMAVADDESPLSNSELGGFVLKTSVAFGRF